MLLEELSQELKRRRKLLPKCKIYLLDFTTIGLCLKVFDWASLLKRKRPIRLQLWLDKPFLEDLSSPQYELQMKLFWRERGENEKG